MTGEEIQLENGGFTRIHNVILETLARARLSPLEFKVVIFVIRKTYGFHKKTDIISISQFEAGCHASHGKVVGAVQNLVRLNVIQRVDHGKQGYEYGFNKYIEGWLPETFETRRPRQQDNFSSASSPDGTGSTKGTSSLDGTRTSSPDGTKTSSLDGTHKRKKETIKDNSTHQEIFKTLARICKLDMKLKAGQIGKTAKSLAGAGYTAADVDTFAAWWKSNDFRGRKGEPPTLANVTEKILQAKQSARPVQTTAPHELAKVVMSDRIEYWRGDVLERTEPLEAE